MRHATGSRKHESGSNIDDTAGSRQQASVSMQKAAGSRLSRQQAARDSRHHVPCSRHGTAGSSIQHMQQAAALSTDSMQQATRGGGPCVWGAMVGVLVCEGNNQHGNIRC